MNVSSRTGGVLFTTSVKWYKNKHMLSFLKYQLTWHQLQSNLNTIKAWDLSIHLHEVLLSQVLIQHVDEVTRKQWEMKAVSQGITEHEAIIKFLEGVLCRGNHRLYRCKQFRKASSQQRLNLIKQNQLCFNCLGNSHRTSQCKVEWRCKFCSRKHNSLLPCESEPNQKNVSHSWAELNKITAANQM